MIIEIAYRKFSAFLIYSPHWTYSCRMLSPSLTLSPGSLKFVRRGFRVFGWLLFARVHERPARGLGDLVCGCAGVVRWMCDDVAGSSIRYECARTPTHDDVVYTLRIFRTKFIARARAIVVALIGCASAWEVATTCVNVQQMIFSDICGVF